MAEIKFHQFEESNRWLNHFSVLRERLHEKGYLFFRGILDKESLLKIRGDMLELADKYGWIKEGTRVTDGIYSGVPAVQKSFETTRLYREILELDSFNGFGQNPVLMLLYSGLLQGEVLEHRRRIGRITTPKSYKNTTPAHQDFFYIRGTVDTYTNWIPTGDCPSELGGLAVLEASNQLGFLQHVPMSGTGGNGVPDEVCNDTGLRWLTTDFKLGDLLLFHSHTIHKAFHNETEDRLRVSLEYRMQRNGEDIHPGSMLYHMKGAFGDDEVL